MLESFSYVTTPRSITESNTTSKFVQSNEELKLHLEYWLSFGVPIVINIVVLIYIMKWICLRRPFKLWRFIFCCKAKREAGETDNNYADENHEVTYTNIKCAAGEQQSVSWLRNKLRCVVPKSVKDPFEKGCLIDERSDLLASDDQYNDCFDNAKLVVKNVKSRRPRRENIIALRELSAKYDAILLQLSAVSCKRRLKRLLKAMNERFDKQKDKRVVDGLLDNTVYTLQPDVANYECKHSKFPHNFTIGSKKNCKQTCLNPFKLFRKSKKSGGILTNSRKHKPYYVDVSSDGRMSHMKDMHSDRKLNGNVIKTLSSQDIATYERVSNLSVLPNDQHGEPL